MIQIAIITSGLIAALIVLMVRIANRETGTEAPRRPPASCTCLYFGDPESPQTLRDVTCPIHREA